MGSACCSAEPPSTETDNTLVIPETSAAGKKPKKSQRKKSPRRESRASSALSSTIVPLDTSKQESDLASVNYEQSEKELMAQPEDESAAPLPEVSVAEELLESSATTEGHNIEPPASSLLAQPMKSESMKGEAGGGGKSEDGAYLMYSALSDGIYYIIWRKEAPPSDAIAFGAPGQGVRIPPFKYKGRSELMKSLHKSKKSAGEGLLQFFRVCRPFQCEAVYFGNQGVESIRIPEMSLFAHHDNDTLKCYMAGDFINLNSIDSLATCLRNTMAEKDLNAMVASGPLPLSTFLARCKHNAESVEVLSFT